MEHKSIQGGEKQTACSHHEDTSQKLSGENGNQPQRTASKDKVPAETTE